MTRELYDRAKQLYGDDELAQAVYEDAETQGHTPKILAGELQLPHIPDARKWLDKKKGRDNQTPAERDAERRIRELEGKIASMNPYKEG